MHIYLKLNNTRFLLKTMILILSANPSANENGLKFFSIRMRILNSEYFFLDLIGFNWIQLGSIGCNWIEKLHFLFKILNSIHNAQKS